MFFGAEELTPPMKKEEADTGVENIHIFAILL